MSNRTGYKMYRFDYGNYGHHSSSYRYGLNNDECKRCLEARERVGYANSFNNGYHSNRFNMNSKGMQPPYFRNSFAPMHGNMFDQRFNANHLGSNNYRYGNNYHPSNMLNNSRPCHSDNCNVVHRAQQNHHMPGNDAPYMFNNSRAHCIRDSMENGAHHMGNNGFHGNYNNGHSSMRRCSHDLKLREMINAPMQPRPIPNDARNSQNNCRSCSNKKPDEPAGSSGMAGTSSNNSGSSSSNAQGPSTSSASTSGNNENQMKNPLPRNDTSCSQHVKNQCCSKSYCCNLPIEKPKCCRNDVNHSVCHCQSQQHSNAGPSTPNNHCSSNNIYFGRNFESQFNRCHQKQTRDDNSCCCCRSNSQQPTTSSQQSHSSTISSTPSTSIVNYGASTSKASPSTVQQLPNDLTRNKKATCTSNCIDCSVGCEVEFPLDAVACIFDCLTEACIIPDAMNGPDMGRLSFDSVTSAAEDGSLVPPRYQHVPVPNSSDPNETYLTLAFETAILALGKQRNVPQGGYLQQVICKQQDQLIQRLRHVELDRLLIEVLKQLTSQLLDGGPTSGLGVSIHPESFPMHTLARFLFASLLTHYDDLAFFVGLRAMRLPNREECMNGMEPIENSMEMPGPHNNHRDGFILSRYNSRHRWLIMNHLEAQQCSLSSTMLSAAKGDPPRLSQVLESARRNIHSSTNLFKLAQDAFRFATPESDHRNRTLLGVAFELGLQVMRMTLINLHFRRREMVRWLVTCATQLGLDALMVIMQNWYQLFTPTEATGLVASTIMSTSARLNLTVMVCVKHLLFSIIFAIRYIIKHFYFIFFFLYLPSFSTKTNWPHAHVI